MFKIETHLHTLYASGCSKLREKEIVEGYLQAGYSGVVVTDHYNRRTEWYPRHAANPLEEFLEGYYRVREAAAGTGLKVYRGAEIRFDENNNDYLLYNFPDALLADPDALFHMGLAKFYPLVREAGALLIQAHPFRDSCRPACIPADPSLLDGLEFFNASPNHQNHHDLAAAYWERSPHLIGISGSDCHSIPEIGGSGILCHTLPETEQALAGLLKSKQYLPILPK